MDSWIVYQLVRLPGETLDCQLNTIILNNAGFVQLIQAAVAETTHGELYHLFICFLS